MDFIISHYLQIFNYCQVSGSSNLIWFLIITIWCKKCQTLVRSSVEQKCGNSLSEKLICFPNTCFSESKQTRILKLVLVINFVQYNILLEKFPLFYFHWLFICSLIFGCYWRRNRNYWPLTLPTQFDWFLFYSNIVYECHSQSTLSMKGISFICVVQKNYIKMISWQFQTLNTNGSTCRCCAGRWWADRWRGSSIGWGRWTSTWTWTALPCPNTIRIMTSAVDHIPPRSFEKSREKIWGW